MQKENPEKKQKKSILIRLHLHHLELMKVCQNQEKEEGSKHTRNFKVGKGSRQKNQRCRNVQKVLWEIEGKGSNSLWSELNKTLNGHVVPIKVRWQLLFGSVVVKEIKEKMENVRSEKKKQFVYQKLQIFGIG